MNDRVILTGGTGLIGRQLIEPLQESGFDVITLGRNKVAQERVEFIEVDLLDQSRVASILRKLSASNLVHLAWHSGGQDRWHAPANLDWAAATLSLIREFADCGGQSVVAAGSCAEYDWSKQAPLCESDLLLPSTLYGMAKATTGQLLVAAAANLEISVAWARIFFCYGPGEPRGRLVGDLIAGLRDGMPVDCSDGRQQRDFLHVRDIGRALTLLLRKHGQGPVNVASGVPVAVRDLAGTVERLIIGNGRVRLGALERSPSDPPLIVADTTRLVSEFGFRPEFDLEGGLADVIRQDSRVT